MKKIDITDELDGARDYMDRIKNQIRVTPGFLELATVDPVAAAVLQDLANAVEYLRVAVEGLAQQVKQANSTE